MKINIYIFLVLILGIIVLVSCKNYKRSGLTKLQSYYENGIPKTSPDNGFRGLNKMMENLGDGKTLNVMLVHGMRTKTIQEFDDCMKDLAWQTNYSNPYLKRVFNGGCNKPNVLVQVYTDKAQTKFLKFIYIHWSPALTEFKEYVKLADDTKKAAAVNKGLKNAIVNDGFGDVMGMHDEAIQVEVFKAFNIGFKLRSMEADEIERSFSKEPTIADADSFFAEPNNQNFFLKPVDHTVIISGSYGSKITQEYLAARNASGEMLYEFANSIDGQFEAFNSDSTTTNKLEAQIMNELSDKGIFLDSSQLEVAGFDSNESYTWFLLTNQLPLFGPVRYNFFTADSEFLHATASMETILEKEREAIKAKSTMIVFYDPNDPLGYHIPNKSYNANTFASEHYNVRVRVARKALFGLLANPAKAHSGAKDNVCVLHTIAHSSGDRILAGKKVKKCKLCKPKK